MVTSPLVYARDFANLTESKIELNLRQNMQNKISQTEKLFMSLVQMQMYIFLHKATT